MDGGVHGLLLEEGREVLDLLGGVGHGVHHRLLCRLCDGGLPQRGLPRRGVDQEGEGLRRGVDDASHGIDGRLHERGGGRAVGVADLGPLGDARAAAVGAGHHGGGLGQRGGVGLLQVARVVEPVQTIGVLQQGVDVPSLVVPHGGILGVHPGGQQRHVRDARGGHAGGNALGPLGVHHPRSGSGRRGVILGVRHGKFGGGRRERVHDAVGAGRDSVGLGVLLSMARPRGAGGGRQESEYCILQCRHRERPVGRRVDHLLPPPLRRTVRPVQTVGELSRLLRLSHGLGDHPLRHGHGRPGGGGRGGARGAGEGTHPQGRHGGGDVGLEHVGDGGEGVGHLGIILLGGLG
mmetsp:Transcript_34828/g.74207  ORF Transcript_34828/g.74207 Transcript_34828/m.74207 type:complete len:349 (+) Transcript_34828:923-1969(+)